MYNKITIAGHVGADVNEENKTLGSNWARLTVASHHRQKNKETEEWEDATTWHTAFVNGKRVNDYIKGIKKGDLVLIEGSMRNSKKEGRESEMFIAADQVKVMKRKNESALQEAKKEESKSYVDDYLPF
jgi:single-strand DNA-binding protein